MPVCSGKIGPPCGQRVVEGVMHQLEPALAADGLDRLDRFGLVAQRADLEAQGFDHADQAMIFQHRLQRLQRHAQVGLPFAVAHAQVVVARDQADRLGPGGLGDLHQGQRLGGLVVGPVVEALDLGHRQKPQPVRRGPARPLRPGPCRRTAAAAGRCAPRPRRSQARAARSSKLTERKPGHRHVVQGEVDHSAASPTVAIVVGRGPSRRDLPSRQSRRGAIPIIPDEMIAAGLLMIFSSNDLGQVQVGLQEVLALRPGPCRRAPPRSPGATRSRAQPLQRRADHHRDMARRPAPPGFPASAR